MINKKIILTGIGAGGGIVQGKVKLVKGINDSSKFNKGDILVTNITDPTMVIMMSQASAIVCNIGGITSHPAIISREIGVPCVVNTKNATKKLKDGMKIEVNGNTGEIYKLE